MARCVLIVDSATGKLIDVAGNVREGGRYRKLVGRMLSADTNPMLDYGANGGTKLEISNGGYAGDEVNIKAKVVNITGDLRVSGDTLTGTGKLDSVAAYPAWNGDTAYEDRYVVSHIGRLWRADGHISAGVEPGADDGEEDNGDSGNDGSGAWESITVGDLISEGGHGSGDKADKVVPSSAGNLAALNAQGNLEDSGVKPSDFAAKADLPYAMVTPGKWEFSGSGYDPSEDANYYIAFNDSTSKWELEIGGVQVDEALGDSSDLVVEFSLAQITATRASLPGHLLDRAGNRVVVTGDTTLTLPAAIPGYIRDFLVRLEISGSTVPTITFSPDGNESVTYETDGDEFPVPDAEGTWLYSFTETAAHTFAVSLKKVNTVAQAAQGGS